MRVFISHSSADSDVAGALINLLRLALSLPSEDIRCTSVEGFRLPGGASTNEVLVQEVHDAELFIALITPDSIRSAYVMFELGARWGAAKRLIPLLARGATSAHLKGPLSGINALDCSIPDQVYQLLDDAGRLLSATASSPSAYQKALDSLIATSGRADGNEASTQTQVPQSVHHGSVGKVTLTEVEYQLLSGFFSGGAYSTGESSTTQMASHLSWQEAKVHAIFGKLAADDLLKTDDGVYFLLTPKGTAILIEREQA